MPRRRTLGVQVFLDGGPVDSQFPLNCPKRHPLAPGLLNRLPSLPLKERRLARRGGFGLAGCGRAVGDGPLTILVLCPLVQWFESPCPAFVQAVGAGGRDRRSCGTPVAVSEKYRTGWHLLGRNDAPFMPNRDPAVQSFQDLHGRPGIAGAFRPWQQLQGVQLEPHRVVPGHSSVVLKAQDLFQAQLRVQRPECRLRVWQGNTEALVESWQELLEHAVGLPDSARVCQSEFSDQPS